MFLVVVLYTEYGLSKHLYSRIHIPPGIGIISWLKGRSVHFSASAEGPIFHFTVNEVSFPGDAKTSME